MKTLPTPRPRRSAAAVQAVVLAATLAAMPATTLAQGANRSARSSGAPVTLNFVNAEIEGVTRAMSAILGQQFVVDPRVKGTMTLYSDQPLRPRDAYRQFVAALRGLGFAVVESGGLYKIVPEADAKLQADTVSIGGVARRGDEVITQIFRLRHENANNLVAVLRPLISPNNTINATAGSNALVITDYADNLQRLAKIVAAMDVPQTGDVEVIALRHAVAADIGPLVQRLADAPGGAAVASGIPGAPGASAVIVDSRSNSLLIRPASPARMLSIRSLVEQLDRPTPNGNALGNVWVVYLKNADAVKLAAVLRAAAAAGGGGGGGLGAQSSGIGASPFGGSSATPAIGSATAGSPQASTPLAASPQPSTGGIVQADPATNSLIITAPEPQYRQLRAMIEQLDTRRAQVYIESMIVEVSGDDAAEFGFQWQGLLGKSGDNNGLVAGTNFSAIPGNILGITAAGATGTLTPGTIGQGLNIGLIRNFAGTYGLAAIARFLQTQTNTNIVSTPNLITLDNEEAKIIVGSNVPFITGQFTNTGTGTTNPFQTIERKDVGITLRIRPQIGESGTVRMAIFQEASSLSQRIAPGTTNAGPTTDKRSIESTVVVDDGQILVLGGLIEDKYTENNSKVPLLGDIPYVGQLFRSQSRSKTRTNLMVFLRPIVMRDGDSAGRLSVDRYDAIRAFQLRAQPVPSRLLPIDGSPVLPELKPEQPKLQAPAAQPLPPAQPTPAVPPAQPVPPPLAAPVSATPLPAVTAAQAVVEPQPAPAPPRFLNQE